MSVNISQIQAYDVVFNAKQLTLGKLKEILTQINSLVEGASICFFFSSDSSFDEYKNEKYFNGLLQVDTTTGGLALCESVNSNESLMTIEELLDAVNRVQIGSTMIYEGNIIQITDDTVIQIKEASTDSPTGTVAEIFIVGNECFFFTSTEGINWWTPEGSIDFCNKIIKWFLPEYCPNGYAGVYHVNY